MVREGVNGQGDVDPHGVRVYVHQGCFWVYIYVCVCVRDRESVCVRV